MNDTIEINNISYEYNKGKRIFENLSLQLNNKEITVLTGKNGSGKTTLTKLIMGILKPSAGEINIFGQNTKALSLGKIGKIIGYVFQYPERQLFAQTVMEELTFHMTFTEKNNIMAKEKAMEMLEMFDLIHVKDSYPLFLSYGEKRRLAIASVLMNEPKYLILDEPTASLDKERIFVLSEILDKLKHEKIGMLIISHNKDFNEKHGDKIIKLEGGKIYE